ncbi:DUF2339 domain-containing protein [Marivita hallyeonensis]|uniref:Uncharacterized membrane protein n=1 Tax=Marivita hallyeonensis TaxID=996342 RepID=A0A1M5MIN8_9RHOB|nr:DUF2339 domain-containing protein [Marivita hallyeonensis]SHG76779.1 Uncharacterized membrane protein [Marivita hallyeonensis]
MFEDGVIALLGLLALFYLLGLPIMVVLLFGRTRELERKIGELGRAAVGQSTAETGGAREPAEAPAAPTEPETAPVEAAGPWEVHQPTEPKVAPEPPKTPGYVDRLFTFLQENWVYAISAVSLALAGVFLVQYGVENGLLPPAARVAAALLFGVALIAAGEWVRRRSGDEGETPTINLPSVFSGAGIVSLFGGTLAARVLYDLIGPGLAFAGFGAITLVALVLGWFYGPMLAAIGLIGGFAAPFILGGSSDTPEVLLLYFGLLALLGLGIDTVRRWAWVSVLTVVLAFAAGVLIWMADDPIAPWLTIYATALALFATLIPARSAWPDHGGRTILYSAFGRRKPGHPIFPVLLSAGTLAATTGVILFATMSAHRDFWLSFALLSALAAIFTIWSKKATGLQDLPLIPAIGALCLVGVFETNGSTLRAFRADRLPEAALPTDTFWLLGVAAAVTLVFAWRSGQSRLFRPLWAAAAVVFLPAMGLVLDFTWRPADVIGAYPWALQAIAVAAVMVFLAERFARADGPDRTRVSLATMSALATVAFTFSVLFTEHALTIAFVAVVLSAAALDRLFKLPLMEWFVLAGVAALSYRLVFDPGIPWLLLGSAFAPLFAQATATAACIAAFFLLRGMQRLKAQTALESAAWAFAGIFACTALAFAIDAVSPTVRMIDEHWGLGIYASVWIMLAAVQMWRLQAVPQFRWIRIGLAAVFCLTAIFALAALLIEENPFISPARVLGPPVLNTLIPAFLLPAVLIGLAAWRLGALPRTLRLGLGALALALASFWLFLTIRHVWQGAEGMRITRGYSQPELYTYTLTLLIVGGALFYQSLARHSDLLRRAGLAVIALAIAKVFLIDISGLTGLIRVFSLLALGLMLAGMAWIDRWARQRAGA